MWIVSSEQNIIHYEIYRSEQKSCEYTNASATASASLSEQKMQLQLVLHGGLSGNIFASWIDLWEYATRSLHWFVNSYIWNCIYYRYYIIQISYHKYYILQISQINYYSCYIQGVPKKVTFKMLLEPGCTRSITSSGHPFQPDLDEPMSGNYFFLLKLIKQNRALLSHVHGKIWPRRAQF